MKWRDLDRRYRVAVWVCAAAVFLIVLIGRVETAKPFDAMTPYELVVALAADEARIDRRKYFISQAQKVGLGGLAQWIGGTDPVDARYLELNDRLLGCSAADVPSLLDGLAHRKAKVQTWSLWYLSRVLVRHEVGEHPDAIPNREAIIATLADAIEAADARVCVSICLVLRQYGKHAAPAVPALVGILEHGGASKQKPVAQTLAYIGHPEATAAVPALQALLGSGNPEAIGFASRALQSIAPETLAAAPDTPTTGR